jgi:hypothetical protein
MEGNDDAGASRSITLRMPPAVAAALDALETATGSVIPRHRLALEALRRGALLLAANPGALFGREAPVARPPPPPAAAPSAPPAASPAAPALVVAAAPAEAPAAPLDASDDPNRYATAAELARLRRALVAAAKRGASILAIATAAGLSGGGSRKALARVKGGEAPNVTLRVVSAATAAAEAWGA